MANPQVEDGHLIIANEIVEALMKVNLSAYESRVLWFLFRKTYGWNKKTDWITLSQFSLCIRLDRRLVHRALTGLSSKGMIVINRDDSQRLKYGFQKNYERWRINAKNRPHNHKEEQKQQNKHGLSSKGMTVIERDDGLSSKEMIGLSSKGMTTKYNSTKDTITKDKNLYAHFEKFWTAYPKKKSKGQAEKAWRRISPDEQLLATMIAVIERAKKSEEWRKEMGKYIPYPATWLNAKGWEDEDVELHPLSGQVSDKTIQNMEMLKEWRPPL